MSKTRAKTKIVKVTAANIKQGQRNRHCFCPVAIAMLEAGFDNVEIDSNILSYEPGDSYDKIHLDTPKFLEEFIVNFDKKGAKGVKPFQFKIVETHYDNMSPYREILEA